jgi:hypothetical protein
LFSDSYLTTPLGTPNAGIWNRQQINHASGRLGEAFLALTALCAVEVMRLGCLFAI